MTTMTNLTVVTKNSSGVRVIPDLTIKVPMTAWQIVRVVRDKPNTPHYNDIWDDIETTGFVPAGDSMGDHVYLYRTVNSDCSGFNSVAVEFGRPANPDFS